MFEKDSTEEIFVTIMDALSSLTHKQTYTSAHVHMWMHPMQSGMCTGECRSAHAYVMYSCTIVAICMFLAGCGYKITHV